MSSSKCSSFSVPFELVEEILYRTPVESLVRFKSTCKRWYALLNDKRFIYKHLDLSHQQFIALSDESAQIFNPLNKALLGIPGNIPSNIEKVVHCDGLLLCICRESSSLAVWNPFMSQVKWIQRPSSSSTIFDEDFDEDFGFGYDNVSRGNYKILIRHKTSDASSKVEIYEFKSRVWRSVGSINNDWWTLWDGISMSGNMYWIAKRIKPYFKMETFIQSFDFSKETFKPICYVPFKSDLWDFNTEVLSGFEGDRLSLLHHHHRPVVNIDVWVTNKVTDKVVSWSKYFNVTLSIFFPYNCTYPTYFIHKTNNIMLWGEELDLEEDNIYVNFYEMGKGEFQNQVETGQRKWETDSDITRLYMVPSLVPVLE